MTKLLLIFRANISVRDKLGFTPRHLAVEKGHEKIMEFLAVMSVTKRAKSGAL
jgi:ankyrin repeat protein